MRMNFRSEHEGTTTFLVYDLREDDKIDRVSLGMIVNNKIPGIANTIYTTMDERRFLKYNVTSKVSLAQYFTGAVSKRRLLSVLSGITEGLLSAEDYMIDPQMLLLDKETIFADVSTGETVLLCLPIFPRQGSEKKDLLTFFKNLIFNIQYDASESSEHVTAIINYLNSTPTISLSDFRKLLNRLTHPGAQAQHTPSVSAPEAAHSGVSVLRAAPAAPQAPASAPVRQAAPPARPTTPAAPSPRPYTPPAAPPQRPAVQTPPAPQNIPRAPGAKGGAANPGYAVPGKSGPAPISSNPPAGDAAGGESISFFYLMQHYNKENASAYKAQKEAKKSGGKSKQQSAPPAAPAAGYAAPGAQTPPATYAARPATPPAAGSYPPRAGASPVQPMQPARPGQPVQPMRPVQPVQPVRPVQPVQPVTPPPRPYTPSAPAASGNFGETIVLTGGLGSGNTVQLDKAKRGAPTPILVRRKNGERIPINRSPFKIGKERSYVDYFVSDNTAVSRSHACILTRGGSYYIIDTNSTNHTYINDRIIESNVEVPLNSGDRVMLGDEEFVFQVL